MHTIPPGPLNTLCILMLVAIWLFASPSLTQASGMLEVTELVMHADQYDKQMVVVFGRVTNVQLAATQKGEMAFGFLLKDAGNTIKVMGLGKPYFHEGDQVVVEGVFSRLRQSGRLTTFNEIKASFVRPLDRLDPELVG